MNLDKVFTAINMILIALYIVGNNVRDFWRNWKWEISLASITIIIAVCISAPLVYIPHYVYERELVYVEVRVTENEKYHVYDLINVGDELLEDVFEEGFEQGFFGKVVEVGEYDYPNFKIWVRIMVCRREGRRFYVRWPVYAGQKIDFRTRTAHITGVITKVDNKHMVN